MTPPLGYYVHHHGDGHLQRALLIAEALKDRVVLLGTNLEGRTGKTPVVDLPDDRPDACASFDGNDGSEDRPSSLHYAPLHHDGVRRRTNAISSWIARERPALMVVDVSVEVAMLARLASTPTVYVRLCGDRSDLPHLEAFHGAMRLLSPFHSELDEPSLPEWISRKTFFAPGLARSAPLERPRASSILVIQSSGGVIAAPDQLLAAAKATPSLFWTVIGQGERPANAPSNLSFAGWVEDPQTHIGRAGVVIGAAGDGVVNGVLAADRPFICLPQARPFKEQVSKAERLAALGSAVVLNAWPNPEDWPRLIERARAQPWKSHQALQRGAGVQDVADWLVALADAPRPGCLGDALTDGLSLGGGRRRSDGEINAYSPDRRS